MCHLPGLCAYRVVARLGRANRYREGDARVCKQSKIRIKALVPDSYHLRDGRLDSTYAGVAELKC
jgi:hypothetical protein